MPSEAYTWATQEPLREQVKFLEDDSFSTKKHCCKSCGDGGGCESDARAQDTTTSAHIVSTSSFTSSSEWEESQWVGGQAEQKPLADKPGRIGGVGEPQAPEVPPWWPLDAITAICTVRVMCRNFNFTDIPIAKYCSDHCWIEITDCWGTLTTYEVMGATPPQGVPIAPGSHVYRNATGDWRTTAWGRKTMERERKLAGDPGWDRARAIMDFTALDLPTTELVLDEDCVWTDDPFGSFEMPASTLCDCVEDAVARYPKSDSYSAIPWLMGGYNCNSFVQWVSDKCGFMKNGKPFVLGSQGAGYTPSPEVMEAEREQRPFERSRDAWYRRRYGCVLSPAQCGEKGPNRLGR